MSTRGRASTKLAGHPVLFLLWLRTRIPARSDVTRRKRVAAVVQSEFCYFKEFLYSATWRVGGAYETTWLLPYYKCSEGVATLFCRWSCFMVDLWVIYELSFPPQVFMVYNNELCELLFAYMCPGEQFRVGLPSLSKGQLFTSKRASYTKWIYGYCIVISVLLLYVLDHV